MNALFRIAFRNIFRQKRRSFLTGLSLWGGYVLVSFSIALTDGTYSHMIDAFTGDRTGHIQIHQKDYLEKPSVERTIPDSQKILSDLGDEKDPRILAVSPRVKSGALAWANERTRPVEVLGIDPTQESQVTRFGEKALEGTPWNENSPLTPVYVGRDIQKQLKIKPGDELILLSQGADGSVANDKFQVSAIIGAPDGTDTDTVFMPLQAAQLFYSSGIHEIAIRLTHPSFSEKVKTKIQQTLSNSEVQVATWPEIEQEFYKAMLADRQGNKITYGIILIMVCVGVLNAVLMTALERMREYGLMKAVGTPPLHMILMIPLEILFLSFISIGIGVLFALPINYWFATVGITFDQPVEISGIFFDRMLGEISLGSMIYPAFIVIGMATVISFIPAYIAFRKSATEALRST